MQFREYLGSLMAVAALVASLHGATIYRSVISKLDANYSPRVTTTAPAAMLDPNSLLLFGTVSVLRPLRRLRRRLG